MIDGRGNRHDRLGMFTFGVHHRAEPPNADAGGGGGAGGGARKALDSARAEREDRRHEARAKKMIGAWTIGPNTRDAVILKMAAKEEFGLRGIIINEAGHQIHPSEVQAARVTVRRMYEQTQARMKESGISGVTLHRANEFDRMKPGAVEAWSSVRSVAEHHKERKDAQGKRSEVGTRTLSAGRILAFHGMPWWVNNPKRGNEFEFLVLSWEPQR